MTDWLPWGAVVMGGTFSTLALTLRALGRRKEGEALDLRAAWWALVVTILASLGVYLLYLLYGERWVWYLQ
jgi:hypothetical protein